MYRMIRAVRDHENAATIHKEIAMPLDILRLSDAQSERWTPVGSQHATAFCLFLLVAACALASLVFACATPFAAFAALAASTLRLPAAMGVVAAAWAVNQAIGFGLLGYPIDSNTMLWGLAIGTAAGVATVVASLVRRLAMPIGRVVALSLSLVAAYAAYECVLFACTPALGGAGAFTAPIVARLANLNAAWMIGLFAVGEGWRMANLWRERLAT